jgi:hypothetical protein
MDLMLARALLAVVINAATVPNRGGSNFRTVKH